jgi:2-amino-4-hydroxy-6-hydroxymethyldihydropteridine diphosphokinase
MTETLIAFGANLGQPRQAYDTARDLLIRTPGIVDLRTSSLYDTGPVGGRPDAPRYQNGAFAFRTTLPPLALLDRIEEIHQKLGRVRRERWEPRVVDLDLIWMDDQQVATENLLLPHPRMHYRWFVLKPAADLLPSARHPVLKETIASLLKRVEDPQPTFLLLGSALGLDRAGRQLQDRCPASRSLHCQLGPTGVPLLRIGSDVVGIVHPPQEKWEVSLDPDRTWAILLGDVPAAVGLGVTIPAVDVRSSRSDSTDALGVFLDSLRPGGIA